MNVTCPAAIPEDNKNCEESVANYFCPRCNLWRNFAVTEKACSSQSQTFCSRQPYVTIIKVPNTAERYLALPNKAVTGSESWQNLPGATVR